LLQFKTILENIANRKSSHTQNIKTQQQNRSS